MQELRDKQKLPDIHGGSNSLYGGGGGTMMPAVQSKGISHTGPSAAFPSPRNATIGGGYGSSSPGRVVQQQLFFTYHIFVEYECDVNSEYEQVNLMRLYFFSSVPFEDAPTHIPLRRGGQHKNTNNSTSYKPNQQMGYSGNNSTGGGAGLTRRQQQAANAASRLVDTNANAAAAAAAAESAYVSGNSKDADLRPPQKVTVVTRLPKI